MENLPNGFTLELCSGAFPLSTDSIALAGFAKLPKSASVLDLGSGCGTLGLMLCATHSDCTVTGIEIDPTAHKTALENAQRNQIQERFHSICNDIVLLPTFIKPGSFRVCISNPPYFVAGPKSKTLPVARSEDRLSLDTLFKSAAWALRYGGDFYLVHRPERLGELFATASKYSLEPKTLQLLRHKFGGPITLVLIQYRKGAKPGLKWDEQYLFEADGSPSPYYKQLYHL